jgi:iron-sulfur cluster insertion protein
MPHSTINITESAASKVWSLMAEEDNLNLLLRVYITGGGLVTVIIDPISLQYLEGAEIDYVMDVNGERFVIRNPNAKTTCGCGSSFSA